VFSLFFTTLVTRGATRICVLGWRSSSWWSMTDLRFIPFYWSVTIHRFFNICLILLALLESGYTITIQYLMLINYHYFCLSSLLFNIFSIFYFICALCGCGIPWCSVSWCSMTDLCLIHLYWPVTFHRFLNICFILLDTFRVRIFRDSSILIADQLPLFLYII